MLSFRGTKEYIIREHMLEDKNNKRTEHERIYSEMAKAIFRVKSENVKFISTYNVSRMTLKIKRNKLTILYGHSSLGGHTSFKM